MELIGISFAWNGGPTAAKIATVDSAGEPAPAADTTAAPTEEPFVPRCVRISVLTRNAHTPTRSHAHALTTSHAQMRRRPRCCASAYDHCEGFAAQVSVTAPPRRQVNATSTFRRTDGCQGGCGCGCTRSHAHSLTRSHHNTLTRPRTRSPRCVRISVLTTAAPTEEPGNKRL